MKLLFLLWSALALLACGGSSVVGEACDTRGSADECEEGAICDADGDESADPVCLSVCEVQEDCEAGHNCNGVTDSSVKACHRGDDGKGK